jgi:dUTP pyrophosphatase
MSNDMNEYIKELKQLKSLNLLPPEELEELDKLITMMESSDVLGLTQESDYSNYKLPIKFVNTSKNPDPNYAKEGDSGMDLRAELTEVGGKYVMKPFERALIPTGLYFELPNGYELQIRPRSGLSFKTGLMAILGTVDTGYRGEVKVILINLSDKECVIEQGERVAQGVIAPRVSSDFGKLIKLESTNELSQTERGENGFGSTGKK